MRRNLFLAMIVLGASGLSSRAQTHSQFQVQIQPHAETLAQLEAPPQIVLTGEGCPVGFSASRQGSLLARAGMPARGVDNPFGLPMVTVHFAKASVARILEVQGNIYGTSAAPHEQLVAGDVVETRGPQSRTQPFHLTGFDPDASSVDWRLAVRQVPVIQGVRFTEIRMSDGTVWHESATSHCRAQLSGFLPVSASLR